MSSPATRSCACLVPAALLAMVASIAGPPTAAADASLPCWSLRVTPEAIVAWPSGAFGAPPADPAVHLGGHVLLRHDRSPWGLRLDGGGATLRTGVGGVEVAWPVPGEQTTLQKLETGVDLAWLAGGVQWGPREPAGGLYAFATAGAAHVRPVGDAEVAPGANVDLPGLPPSSTTWRLAAGAGLHFPLDAEARGAFVGELEYAYGGAVNFVGANGVDGAFPDVRYAARRARLALLAARFGVTARL